MSFTWDDLPFWRSGEWQVITEKLDELDSKGILYCPSRQLLFAGLDACPYDTVKVMFIGQDPYPGLDDSTGIAFSVKKGRKFPPTLQTILKEYSDDLHYDVPKSGDLTPWCKEGVLLWNAVPSCLVHQSLSHDWTEWHELTKEIINALSKRHIVFVFIGAYARSFVPHVDVTTSTVLEVGHPSPRGNIRARNPFTGSRIFTTVNDKLKDQGFSPINWRLS